VTYWLLHNFWWQAQREIAVTDCLKTAKELFRPV